MTTRGLIQRVVIVELGLPGTEGVRFEGLRVGFRVEHRAGRQPSLGTLDIYNLARSALGRFKSRRNVVRLFVGYDGVARQIFQGNPVRNGLVQRMEGTGDRILTIDATDGGRGFTDGFLLASYSSKVTWEQVISDILDATGWTRGQISVPPGFSLPLGGVFMDRAPEILDRIAALVPPNGGRWFVRDGALYIVANGKGTTEPALLISSREGNLIGAPTPTRKGLRVRALLDATMRPSQRFQVQHPDVSGNYIANDVVFTGDSWSGEFYMDITGTSLEAT